MVNKIVKKCPIKFETIPGNKSFFVKTPNNSFVYLCVKSAEYISIVCTKDFVSWGIQITNKFSKSTTGIIWIHKTKYSIIN